VGIAAIELGLGSALLVGAAEAHDPIVDSVLGEARGVVRGEGGGFVLLESLSAAIARDHVPLASVLEHRALRGDPAPALLALAAPPPAALVVTGSLPSAVAGALARSAWRDTATHGLLARVGQHEAIGALALAVAVAELASGRAEQALVVSAQLDVVYLTRLARYEART
jgi:hypothetical protein